MGQVTPRELDPTWGHSRSEVRTAPVSTAPAATKAHFSDRLAVGRFAPRLRELSSRKYDSHLGNPAPIDVTGDRLLNHLTTTTTDVGKIRRLSSAAISHSFFPFPIPPGFLQKFLQPILHDPGCQRRVQSYKDNKNFSGFEKQCSQ